MEELPRSPDATIPPKPAPKPAPVPRVDADEALRDAGLVMIETDRKKAPEQPVAEEPPQLGRPRRERPRTQAQEEELKQVETKR